MRSLVLLLLLALAACAPARTQPPPGYCPSPFRVGADGACENDQPQND